MKRAFLPSPEVLVLALAFWAGIGLVRDFDIWWHLAAGREIVASASIPRIDSWSHTVPGQQWFAHEWLAEIFFWGVWSVAGANGLLVWKALMGLATLATLAALYRLADPEKGIGHLCGLIGATVCVHYHLLERPHLFTNAMLAVQVLALESWLRGGKDRLWWLPGLYLFWANLHGGVIIGLGTFGLYLAGQVLEWAAGDEMAVARGRRIALVAAVCLAASLVNPRGFELITYPLKYVGHGTLASEITEWTSPDFREFKPMEGLLLALLLLLLVARSRPARPTELLLLLAGLHLFLQSKRNIVFVALFVLPAAVERLAALAGPTTLGRGIARAGRTGGGWALLVLFVVFTSVRTIAIEPPRISANYYPDGVVEYLKTHRLEGRMMNEFVFGGYFIWKLFPDYKVFIDSRTDLFFDEFVFQEYLAVFKLAMGWKQVLDKRKVDWIVFEQGHPLGTLLEATGEWPEVYHDGLAVIRVRRKSKNQPRVSPSSSHQGSATPGPHWGGGSLGLHSNIHSKPASYPSQQAQKKGSAEGLRPPSTALRTCFAGGSGAEPLIGFEYNRKAADPT